MGWIKGRLTAMALGVAVSSAALAAVPYTFTNQGHLVDAAGASIEGSHNLTFAIYGSTGGALWTEPHPSVALQGGYYSVELGGIVPLPEDLFATGPRFLGVTIDSGPELAPRMQLVSVPTARVSQAMEIASSAPFACDQAAQRGRTYYDSTLDRFRGCTATGWKDLGTPAPPVVTTVSPASGPTSGGRTITISGHDFQVGSNVYFGSVAATNVTVLNSTTLTATLPATTSVTGAVTVSVQSPSAPAGALAGGFTYVASGNDAGVPAPDCKSIFAIGGTWSNALYWIDLTGGATNDAFQVYCDMTTLDANNQAGWMLVASFSDHQIYNKSSIDAVFGATVQNGWSSRFGNAPTNALRVHAGASANSGGSGSTFDFYYKQTTAVAYKRWFSGNSGVNQGYVYGADVHYAMLQTNGAYNLKYRVDYPNHQFNNFSDPSGTWPDWWGGLTTGGVSLNFNGAQDGSFGVSNGPGRTGQDMSGNNAIVGMDDGLTMFVACSSGTDFCFGNPTANNTSASTNVWIWIK